MTKFVHFKNYVLLLTLSLMSISLFAQTDSTDDQEEIPELVFMNPKLISGSDKKEGAVYLFSNVATGIDATITLMKFSQPNLTINSIDNPTLGWAKAFQPEFGIAGNVPANSKWWIDFRLNFFEAGTKTPLTVDKFSLSTIDVDGDGVSIREWVTLKGASQVKYSPVTYLAPPPVITLPTCPKCKKQSWSKICLDCLGTGIDPKKLGKKKKKCGKCDGVGLLFATCDHAWTGADAEVAGPTQNFTNIDTAATQVMATYVYDNINSFDFTYGGQSGSTVSNAGVRLNSMWFKSFNLAPPTTLPVKLSNFAALFDKKNVNLSWTAAEENFSNYRLQRSVDGKTFSDIAVIFPSGNATANQYAYKDANVTSATGMLYYRLVLVDKTEEVTYSDLRVVRLSKEEAAISLATYPNPATDNVRVTLPSAWQGKSVSLELYTASGIKVKGVQLSSASQTETINLNGISKGLYVVKATAEGVSAQQRVVKN